MLIDMKTLRAKKQAEKDAAAGCVSVSRCIIKGQLCLDDEDYEQAEKLFREAAEAGSGEAALLLGKLLALDTSDIGDERECWRWLEQAFKAGYVEAQQLLVDLFCDLDCPCEAEYWYFKAPEHMDPQTLNRIGECYLDDLLLMPYDTDLVVEEYSREECRKVRETKREYLSKAYGFFKDAAAKGCHEAELNLGKIFSNEEFCGRFSDKAAAYFLKAAAGGCVEGFLRAAEIKAHCGELTSAEAFYLKAAKDGWPDAMFAFARFLEQYGNGLRQQEATGWFLRAALLGHCSSLFEAGIRLVEGKGVKKDVKKGVDLLVEAVESGYSLTDSDKLETIAAGLNVEEGAPLRKFLDKYSVGKKKSSFFEINLQLKEPPEKENGEDDEDIDALMGQALPVGVWMLVDVLEEGEQDHPEDELRIIGGNPRDVFEWLPDASECDKQDLSEALQLFFDGAAQEEQAFPESAQQLNDAPEEQAPEDEGMRSLLALLTQAQQDP